MKCRINPLEMRYGSRGLLSPECQVDGGQIHSTHGCTLDGVTFVWTDPLSVTIIDSPEMRAEAAVEEAVT